MQWLRSILFLFTFSFIGATTAPQHPPETNSDIARSVAGKKGVKGSAPIKKRSRTKVVTPINSDEDKLFLKGYDPVAYVTQNSALKGKSEFTHTYKGVQIQFANSRHKKRFIKAPKKYWPQYGAWCAYAMANKGTLVRVNPKAFKVINGRTYLFYKSLFHNTLTEWNEKDDEQQIKKADANWKANHIKVISSPARRIRPKKHKHAARNTHRRDRRN